MTIKVQEIIKSIKGIKGALVGISRTNRGLFLLLNKQLDALEKELASTNDLQLKKATAKGFDQLIVDTEIQRVLQDTETHTTYIHEQIVKLVTPLLTLAQTTEATKPQIVMALRETLHDLGGTTNVESKSSEDEASEEESPETDPDPSPEVDGTDSELPSSADDSPDLAAMLEAKAP